MARSECDVTGPRAANPSNSPRDGGRPAVVSLVPEYLVGVFQEFAGTKRRKEDTSLFGTDACVAGPWFQNFDKFLSFPEAKTSK